MRPKSSAFAARYTRARRVTPRSKGKVEGSIGFVVRCGLRSVDLEDGEVDTFKEETMRILAILGLAICVAACNPYMAAVSVVTQGYGVATDERSVTTQARDTEIEAEIKAALIESPTPGMGNLSVISRQGVVLLAGVVPPGSPVGLQAVAIARSTSGVKRVETFFVSSRPSVANDIELEAQIKEAWVADPNLESRQVDVDVYAGHVVLAGVVSSPEQAQEFVNDASAVPGVLSVQSYIQLPQ